MFLGTVPESGTPTPCSIGLHRFMGVLPTDYRLHHQSFCDGTRNFAVDDLGRRFIISVYLILKRRAWLDVFALVSSGSVLHLQSRQSSRHTYLRGKYWVISDRLSRFCNGSRLSITPTLRFSLKPFSRSPSLSHSAKPEIRISSLGSRRCCSPLWYECFARRSHHRLL